MVNIFPSTVKCFYQEVFSRVKGGFRDYILILIPKLSFSRQLKCCLLPIFPKMPFAVCSCEKHKVKEWELKAEGKSSSPPHPTPEITTLNSFCILPERFHVYKSRWGHEGHTVLQLLGDACNPEAAASPHQHTQIYSLNVYAAFSAQLTSPREGINVRCKNILVDTGLPREGVNCPQGYRRMPTYLKKQNF